MTARPDTEPVGRPAPGLMRIVALARETVAFFTELAVDQVVSCRTVEGGWIVEVDVLEAAARMGDNDLLATYRVELDRDGVVTGITRLRRYHREDSGEDAP